MYEYIKGLYVDMYKDCIIIENNNIGYKIFTSGNTMAKLPSMGEKVLLYIQQIVRQDFIGLYGFLTKEELEFFNMLLTINGVGAKAALSLLSISNISKLKYAIKENDEKLLIKAQGIGKKTAQRIILELQDKIDINCTDEFEDLVENDTKVTLEAAEALISLGYTEKEAKKAVDACSERKCLENIIKESLRYLMK